MFLNTKATIHLLWAPRLHCAASGRSMGAGDRQSLAFVHRCPKKKKTSCTSFSPQSAVFLTCSDAWLVQQAFNPEIALNSTMCVTSCIFHSQARQLQFGLFYTIKLDAYILLELDAFIKHGVVLNIFLHKTSSSEQQMKSPPEAAAHPAILYNKE